jgi:uncharacterized protein YjbI with pentapeptide repeats
MTILKSVKWRKPAPKETPTVDLDKIEAALNESSRHAAAQWLGYLSLLTYLFFTTVAVTDYDLLVETPIKLPLIGVELGLFSFFVWTPALFLVVHLYIVRKAALLAKRAAFYREQLTAQKVTGAQLTARKNRLDAFAVTSLLLQADEGEEQRSERMLPGLTWAVVYTTLFLLPLALYLAFQIFFLAYQSEAVTTWHRGVLVIGAYLAFVGAQRAGAMRGERKNAFLSRSLGITVILFSSLVFTFPGEVMHMSGVADVAASIYKRDAFPNVLRPRQPERLFVETKKAGKLEDANTLDLAGRDFSGRNLQGAWLSGVNLRGVRLRSASLQKADLRDAGLQGADLRDAELQGADLRHASLQGANLRSAGLQGAYLSGAGLQGADLSFAGLQGAKLSSASLQGADLSEAGLQGAYLNGTGLQGAILNYAHLQGADLSHANLQGATLGYASLRGAILINVDLWRTNLKGGLFENANREGAFFLRPNAGPVAVTAEQVVEWSAHIRDQDRRKWFESRLTEFGDPFDDIAAWAETTNELHEIFNNTSLNDRMDIIAQSLCKYPDNSAAIRGIIYINSNIWVRYISIAAFQSFISDKQRCPAAEGLTKEDWRKLAEAVAYERRWLLNFEADQWFERAGLKKK